MADMIRKQLYVERRHENMLKKRSSDLGITEAEVVRDALDAYAAYSPDSRLLTRDRAAWLKEKEFIGTLMKGAVPAQEPGAAASTKPTWRRDELHER